eukprot:tig00000383_g24672.t1
MAAAPASDSPMNAALASLGLNIGKEFEEVRTKIALLESQARAAAEEAKARATAEEARAKHVEELEKRVAQLEKDAADKHTETTARVTKLEEQAIGGLKVLEEGLNSLRGESRKTGAELNMLKATVSALEQVKAEKGDVEELSVRVNKLAADLAREMAALRQATVQIEVSTQERIAKVTTASEPKISERVAAVTAEALAEGKKAAAEVEALREEAKREQARVAEVERKMQELVSTEVETLRSEQQSMMCMMNRSSKASVSRAEKALAETRRAAEAAAEKVVQLEAAVRGVHERVAAAELGVAAGRSAAAELAAPLAARLDRVEAAEVLGRLAGALEEAERKRAGRAEGVQQRVEAAERQLGELRAASSSLEAAVARILERPAEPKAFTLALLPPPHAPAPAPVPLPLPPGDAVTPLREPGRGPGEWTWPGGLLEAVQRKAERGELADLEQRLLAALERRLHGEARAGGWQGQGRGRSCGSSARLRRPRPSAGAADAAAAAAAAADAARALARAEEARAAAVAQAEAIRERLGHVAGETEIVEQLAGAVARLQEQLNGKVDKAKFRALKETLAPLIAIVRDPARAYESLTGASLAERLPHGRPEKEAAHAGPRPATARSRSAQRLANQSSPSAPRVGGGYSMPS